MTRLTTAELERLRALSETAARHEADPVALVPADASTPRRELAAFLAAGLAFGNVAAITRSVRQVLGSLDDPNALERAGHRWVRGADIRFFPASLRRLWRCLGSAVMPREGIPSRCRGGGSDFRQRPAFGADRGYQRAREPRFGAGECRGICAGLRSPCVAFCVQGFF